MAEAQVKQASRDQKIVGASMMAETIRRHDWQATPLGAIETWPDILVANVNMMLATDLPMQIFWGCELYTIQNDALAAQLGERAQRDVGRPAAEFWKDAWPVVGELLANVYTTGAPVRRINALIPVQMDGVMRDMFWNYSYSPIYGAGGTVLGVLNIAQDVTAAVESHSKLHESNERLRLALDAARQGTWSYDPASRLLTGDDRLRQLFDADRNEAPIEFWLSRVHSEDREASFARLNAALRGETDYDVEQRVAHHGDSRWIRSKARVLRDGDSVRMVGIVEDITFQRQSEAALRQSEKLAVVGRLASSIAHEINNPLESLTNLIYLIGLSAKDEPTRQYTEAAEQELRRVAAITSQTLRFHKQASSPQAVHVHELLNSVLVIFQARLKNRRIALETRHRETKPIRCYEGEIRQVLSNLIGNAIEAMASGGRLLVRSSETIRRDTDERGVQLVIADNGEGMGRDTQKRLFEAFFTTKGIQGTGLGLWVSKGIIDRHLGKMRVRSSRGPGHRGTVFCVFLPYRALAENPVQAAEERVDLR